MRESTSFLSPSRLLKSLARWSRAFVAWVAVTLLASYVSLAAEHLLATPFRGAFLLAFPLLALVWRFLPSDGRRRAAAFGLEAVAGDPHEGPLAVSSRGRILCPRCDRLMRVAAPHEGLDALIWCGPCGLILKADRNVSRVVEEARLVARGVTPEPWLYSPDFGTGPDVRLN